MLIAIKINILGFIDFQALGFPISVFNLFMTMTNISVRILASWMSEGFRHSPNQWTNERWCCYRTRWWRDFVFCGSLPFLSFEGKLLEVDTLIRDPLFSEDAELLGWGKQCWFFWLYPLSHLCQQYIPTWLKTQHIPQPWVWPQRLMWSPSFNSWT